MTRARAEAPLPRASWQALPFPSTTHLAKGRSGRIQSDIFTAGSGYLDVNAALATYELAPSTLGAAISPSAYFDKTSNTGRLTSATGSVLGNGIIWGSG